MKKYEEDDLRRKIAEKKAAELKAKGEEDQVMKKAKKHGPIKRRRSFAECQLKFEEALDLY